MVLYDYGKDVQQSLSVIGWLSLTLILKNMVFCSRANRYRFFQQIVSVKFGISFFILISAMIGVEAIAQTGQKPANFTIDFEEGRLRGWITSGEAFENQPTYGDNIAARNPGEKANHQGNYWIGGKENYQRKTGQNPGDEQGNYPRGTLKSPKFRVNFEALCFLLGGENWSGSAPRTIAPNQMPAGSNNGVVLRSGVHSTLELAQAVPVSVPMTRYCWDLRSMSGNSVYIEINDSNRGHVNFDDVQFVDDFESYLAQDNFEKLNEQTYVQNLPVPVVQNKTSTTPDLEIRKRHLRHYAQVYLTVEMLKPLRGMAGGGLNENQLMSLARRKFNRAGIPIASSMGGKDVIEVELFFMYAGADYYVYNCTITPKIRVNLYDDTFSSVLFEQGRIGGRQSMSALANAGIQKCGEAVDDFIATWNRTHR